MVVLLKKWLVVVFTVVLFLMVLVSCSSENERVDEEIEISDENQEVGGEEIELIMDWSVFESIGVDPVEAESIFTKLGLNYLTNLEAVGTSTINYRLFPFGIEENPIEIMVEQGEITQVTLRYLHVADGARDAWFDNEKLPDTWYFEGEDGYKDEIENKIGIVMYDIYLYENAYYVGVNWESRELYYFE